MKIFIDTEFTNFIDTGLISIGLVAETGEEAYFETDYEASECSEFVRTIVLPLLGLEPNAYVPKAHLAERLLTWLTIVRPTGQDVTICFDYTTDWTLLVDAFNYQVPHWVKSRNVDAYINSLLQHEFFVRQGLPDHHALYDARANAYAFREAPDDPYIPVRLKGDGLIAVLPDGPNYSARRRDTPGRIAASRRFHGRADPDARLARGRPFSTERPESGLVGSNAGFH